MNSSSRKKCNVCKQIQTHMTEAGLRFKGGKEEDLPDKFRENAAEDNDRSFTKPSTTEKSSPAKPEKKQKQKSGSCFGKKPKKEEPYEPAERRDSSFSEDYDRVDLDNVPTTDRFEQLEEKVANLTNQLRCMAQQRDKEAQQTGKELEKVATLQSRISCLAEQLAILKESTSLDDRVRSLQKQMSDLFDEMDSLKETAVMEDRAKCLQEQLKCLAEEVSALQDDKDLEMNVKCLQAQVEEIACGLNALRESDVLEKKVQSLQAQINCLADEMTSLRDNHPLQQELLQLQECINDFAIEVSIIKENDCTENKVRILNDYIMELSEQINELEDNDEVDARVKDLHIQMRSLVLQLDQVMENAAIEYKVNCLKKQVSDLFNERHARQKSENLERTCELANEISQIKQEITRIKGGDNLEERIATLQEQIIMLLQAQKVKAATCCKPMGMQRVNGRDAYNAAERRASAQKSMPPRTSTGCLKSLDQTEYPTQRPFCGTLQQASSRRKSGSERSRAPRTPSEPKPIRKREFSHAANEAQRSRSLQRNKPRSVEKVTKIEYFERPKENVRSKPNDGIIAKRGQSKMNKDYWEEPEARKENVKEFERLKGASDVEQKGRIRALKEADKKEGMNVYHKRNSIQIRTLEQESKSPARGSIQNNDYKEEDDVQRRSRRTSTRRSYRNSDELESEVGLEKTKARVRCKSQDAKFSEARMDDTMERENERRSSQPRRASIRIKDCFEDYERSSIRFSSDASMMADAMQDFEAESRPRRMSRKDQQLDDELEYRNSRRHSSAHTHTWQKGAEQIKIRDSHELVPARLKRRKTEEALEKVDDDQSLSWEQNRRTSNARSRYSDADDMRYTKRSENAARTRARSMEPTRQKELRTCKCSHKFERDAAGETQELPKTSYSAKYARRRDESLGSTEQDDDRSKTWQEKEAWTGCGAIEDIREDEKYKRLQNTKLSQDASALAEIIKDPRYKARVERISRSAKELEDALEEVIEAQMVENRKYANCRERIGDIILHGYERKSSRRKGTDENETEDEHDKMLKLKRSYSEDNLKVMKQAEANEHKRAKNKRLSDGTNEYDNEDLAVSYRQSGGMRDRSKRRIEKEDAEIQRKLHDYQNAIARRRRAREREELNKPDEAKASKRPSHKDFKESFERRQRIRSGNEITNALLKQNKTHGHLTDSREQYAEEHSEAAEASALEPDSQSSCCSHCANDKMTIVKGCLCEAINKLIGKHKPDDVALKILQEKNGIYHINATVRKTGVTIGCISATEKAFEDAEAKKFFEKFLMFLIVSPGDKQSDKNAILKKTFMNCEK